MRPPGLRDPARELRALRAFLPPGVLGVRGPLRRPARVPVELRYDAALLLCDISGFTALTELLEARGKEGAEIARVANAVFRQAVAMVEARDGVISGFAGDAMLAFFEGERAVARAREAAGAIRDALSSLVLRTTAGPLAPRVAMALAVGSVSERHLGDAGERIAGRCQSDAAPASCIQGCPDRAGREPPSAAARRGTPLSRTRVTLPAGRRAARPALFPAKRARDVSRRASQSRNPPGRSSALAAPRRLSPSLEREGTPSSQVKELQSTFCIGGDKADPPTGGSDVGSRIPLDP